MFGGSCVELSVALLSVVVRRNVVIDMCLLLTVFHLAEFVVDSVVSATVMHISLFNCDLMACRRIYNV